MGAALGALPDATMANDTSVCATKSQRIAELLVIKDRGNHARGEIPKHHQAIDNCFALAY
jgi:hypothetical protein